MKLNAFIHQGAYAALDLGEPMASVPFALLGLVGTTVGKNCSSDLFTIKGGGSSRGGETSSSDGTVDQSKAASQAALGECFSVVGGFWSLFAVQIPGAPLLTIRLTSTNIAVILWPSPSAGFILQQNSGLNPANWGAVTETVADDGTNRFIIVTPLAGNRFYRLLKP